MTFVHVSFCTHFQQEGMITPTQVLSQATSPPSTPPYSSVEMHHMSSHTNEHHFPTHISEHHLPTHTSAHRVPPHTSAHHLISYRNTPSPHTVTAQDNTFEISPPPTTAPNRQKKHLEDVSTSVSMQCLPSAQKPPTCHRLPENESFV